MTEGVDRALHHAPGAREVGDVLTVGDCLAAHCLDLLDDLHRRARRAALTVHVASEVVDHDLGALAGERQRVLTADAAPGTGHADHPALTNAHASTHLKRLLGAAPAAGACRACHCPAGA